MRCRMGCSQVAKLIVGKARGRGSFEIVGLDRPGPASPITDCLHYGTFCYEMPSWRPSLL